MQPIVKKMGARPVDDLAADIRAKLDCPIMLVGMMGAGKSKLGRMIAKALDVPFYDSDDEIEKSAGCTITEIFERFGEISFRQAESKIMLRLIDGGPCVIASGGGAVMNPTTAELAWTRTCSIWVRADLDLMVARTTRHGNRPLLKDKDPRVVLSDLIKIRYPVYERANVVVDSHDGPATDTLYDALTRLDDFLSVGEVAP
jgi:shikimate kinase